MATNDSRRDTRDGAAAAALTRRDFLRTSAATTAAGAAALLASGNYAFAQGSDTIRVGLIGCGGRGTGAAGDCVSAAPGVVLVAMGDLFKDRLDGSRERLSKDLKEKYQVTDDRAFSGFDNYKGVIGSGVDLVILATPPGFRPLHFAAAVDAGKHVFMEKPVAVDPAGVRSVIAASERADQKRLGVVAGTQRRHQLPYIETMKRIHDGAIGEIVSAQCYWNQGGLWKHDRRPDESDTEWQIRNWLYFTWLSGDHIVEQHVHNLDVINWAMRAHPVKATGMGGRQVRTDPAYGHIFDHFTVEYEYPGGIKMLSMCRQIDGTATRVSEHLIGTRGSSNAVGSIRAEPGYWTLSRSGMPRSGSGNWRYEGPDPNPYVQEHTDLIASIRANRPLNEGRQIAESTLTAILGRESAYTGKELTWDEVMNAKQDLTPDRMAFGPLPVPPVAVPGKTALERTLLPTVAVAG